jgi:hypothetical protein
MSLVLVDDSPRVALNLSQRRLDDLYIFGEALVRTKDVDPIYPLLKEVIRSRGLDREQAHWLVYLYLTFYNTSSAWKVFRELPDWRAGTGPFIWKSWEQVHRPQLKINIERRGMRGGKWVEALDKFCQHMRDYPAIESFLRTVSPWVPGSLPGPRSPEQDYLTLWDRLQTIPYVGRWACFKWLDLLQHVMDFPIRAPDMRLAYCSGPRQALEELYVGETSNRQDPAYITWLDGLGNDLRARLDGMGLSLTFDLLETVLCNYHSLCAGRYYVSHDLDENLSDTLTGIGDPEPWMAARKAIFDPRLLGEVGGWTGVRKDLCTLYKRTGQVWTG